MGALGAERLNLVVPGTVDYLDTVRAFVERNARTAGFAEDDVDAIVLSLDEAVANIVEHAYQDSNLPPEEQTMQLEMELDRKALRITLRDQGKPFNPTLAPEVDLDQHLAQYRSDGLGIHFIRELMDEMTYNYRSGIGNVLEMVKYRA